MNDAKRILVTGGLGVNGVIVTRQLIERGMRPLVLDFREDYSLIPGWQDRFDFVRGDVTDMAFLTRLFKDRKPDAIIHLAAHISPDMDNEPHRSFMVNSFGTACMLEAAHQAGIKRFIYSSSKAVYGPTPDHVGEPGYKPVEEEYEKRPVKAYDVTKLAAEQLGCVYRQVFGMEFAALRFAGIYGPGKQTRHGKMSIRSRLVEDPAEGKPVTLAKGGDSLDDMVYVEDVARALIDAALTKTLNHTAYNIGNGRGYTIKEYAAAVKAVISDAVMEIGPGDNPLGHDTHRAAVFDIIRAQQDFGYTPRYTLEEGVRDYIDKLRGIRRNA